MGGRVVGEGEEREREGHEGSEGGRVVVAREKEGVVQRRSGRKRE